MEKGRGEQQMEGGNKTSSNGENLCDLFTERQKLVILTDCSLACSFT